MRPGHTRQAGGGMTHTITFDYDPAGIVPWGVTCHARLDDPCSEVEAIESARYHQTVEVPYIEGTPFVQQLPTREIDFRSHRDKAIYDELHFFGLDARTSMR